MLRNQNEEQEKRLDFIEKEIRIRNLILFGIAEEEKTYPELETLIIGVIKGSLDVDLEKSEIEFVKRIGKKSNKIRPIVFAVTTLGKKIEILQNKKKLDGTNCYIKQDYPKKIQEIRKTLQPLLEQETEKGNKAVIQYDKIVLIGKNNQKRQLSQSPQHSTSNEADNPAKRREKQYTKEPILKKPRNSAGKTLQTSIKAYNSSHIKTKQINMPSTQTLNKTRNVESCTTPLTSKGNSTADHTTPTA